MGKAQREKGKRGEREVARILKEHGYENAHRGQQYQGGTESPDVIGIPGIHFEVKRVEHLNLSKAMEQAIADSGEKEVPVVVHRRSGSPWMVTLDFEEFIEYVKCTQMACYEGCCCWPRASREWVGK